MFVEQFVMAYSAEQDRLRAILPDGFKSLRPVLRINAEIIDCKTAYLEFNTAIEKDGIKGWLNIDCWHAVDFEKNGKTTVFRTDALYISFAAVGIQGACPAEKDNAGCFFLPNTNLRLPETITANKEFCNCAFKWDFDNKGASGKSIGKTLPAVATAIQNIYPKSDFTLKNAAAIPCQQVLGAYKVEFDR